jgi:hypothetical protein
MPIDPILRWENEGGAVLPERGLRRPVRDGEEASRAADGVVPAPSPVRGPQQEAAGGARPARRAASGRGRRA